MKTIANTLVKLKGHTKEDMIIDIMYFDKVDREEAEKRLASAIERYDKQRKSQREYRLRKKQAREHAQYDNRHDCMILYNERLAKKYPAYKKEYWKNRKI